MISCQHPDALTIINTPAGQVIQRGFRGPSDQNISELFVESLRVNIDPTAFRAGQCWWPFAFNPSTLRSCNGKEAA